MVTNLGTALGSFNADNLRDGSTATKGFDTNTAILSGGVVHIDLGFGNERTVLGWEFYAGDAGVGITATWNIEYSDNNSSWTNVYTGMDMSGVANSASLKVTWSDAGAHRYWQATDTVDGLNGSTHNRLEIWVVPNGNMTLISEPVVALAVPDEAHIILFEEDVDSITLNTDLFAWVSRYKQTVTADSATDDKLDATGHSLVNTGRVRFTSSAGDLPNPLAPETVYYVVNKTANDFEVSLTSGGAAVDITNNGTGTHAVHAVTQATLADEGDYDTSKQILTGTADISGQPSGTSMVWFLDTKNTKKLKFNGVAYEWK
jgi:hypothetical protein